MPTILFTGFPGFLGSALLPRVLGRDAASEAICVVQPRFAALAQDKVTALVAERPALRGRIRLLEGDITRPALGLADAAATTRALEEIYHLAAVYDLQVSRELGMRVNVRGTRNVLELPAGCPALRRLHYVSTCYVSGRYAGIFGEDDFDRGRFSTIGTRKPNTWPSARSGAGWTRGCRRRSIARRSSSATARRARRRSTTGRMSFCAGSCASRGSQSCR